MNTIPAWTTVQAKVDQIKPLTNDPKEEQSFKQQKQKLWIGFARERRTHRFLRLLLLLLDLADKGEKTTYGKVAERIQTSHFEVVNLLSIVAKFCVANNLPYYPVLVKGGDGTVGDGYFAFFDPSRKHTSTPLDQQKFEKECEEKCFAAGMPEAFQLTMRAAEFIAQS